MTKQISNKSKISIDASSLDTDVRKRGIGLYVFNLINQIKLSNYDTSDYCLLRSKNDEKIETIIYPLQNLPERILWFSNAIVLKMLLERNNISLFHSTHPYNLPISRKFNTIATVYDLIPLIFYNDYLKNKFVNAKLSYRYYLNNLKKADHLIAISERTKQDCIEYLGISENRITTIHLGIDTNIFQYIEDEELLENIKKKHSLPSKFFLYVGGADFRKNVIRLVNAFGKIANSVEENLVLVGQWYPAWISNLQNQLQSLGIQQRVHFLSFVETEDLVCLYTLTTALLFPSLYEGFGLPVLEAFSCQTPVLCSNNSSLIEIAKDCAVLVDPYQEDDISRGILKIAQDEKLRNELSIKGYNRSKEFSIEKMAKETLEVYHNVLS